MKKKLIFGSACLGLVLVLSACGTATSPTQNAKGAPEARPDRRPDFGQPKTQPEVRGVVKSAVGNEITVLKIDQPQRSTSTATSTATGTGSGKLNLGGGSNRGGGMGGFSGGRPGGEGGGGASSTTDRTALLAQIKAMSTGEATITIPVGIKMLKASTDGTRTMVEANISDVIADKMITVWLDTSITDKKVASFVLIN